MPKEVTNEMRAEWGRQTLLAHCRITENADHLYEEDETVTADVLANLMHFAARANFSFDNALLRAEKYFEEEERMRRQGNRT